MTTQERLDALAEAVTVATAALDVVAEHLSELRVAERDQRDAAAAGIE